MDDRETALWYHERTKHHPGRYARSKGYLDWAIQPDPFRRYEGAEQVELILPGEDDSFSYADLYHLENLQPRELNSGTLSSFFYHSLAISAWKSMGGEKWALRCNPSSGNLHPTEGYIVIGSVDELQAGVYHYRPDLHGLERLAGISGALSSGFFVGLTSILWREAWKYGERAYRYCQHDVGHAAAALRFSARLNGWRMIVLNEVKDEKLAHLLGIDRAAHPGESEHPDLLAWVATDAENAEKIPAIERDWKGRPNQLSKDHDDWSAIEKVQQACTGKGEPHTLAAEKTPSSFPFSAPKQSARRIIRTRRSAQVMDGETSIPREVFYSMLARVTPDLAVCPWDAQTWPSMVSLGLFVHLVDGLDPGLYLLLRSPDHEEELRRELTGEFEWQRPEGCPDALRLYLLQRGDTRDLAAKISCTQDIAGMSAFSLGMFARFESPIRTEGAPFYRRLFWETGMIGQVLYLEAEAHGVRGTGIGCYFDDLVHQCFGIRSKAWQSLYHFTVGGPLNDERLATLPAYPGR